MRLPTFTASGLTILLALTLAATTTTVVSAQASVFENPSVPTGTPVAPSTSTQFSGPLIPGLGQGSTNTLVTGTPTGTTTTTPTSKSGAAGTVRAGGKVVAGLVLVAVAAVL
ncbi:hypothetical protein BGW39_011253 [Mortierella sp. 14UC]|nr:hypothetical protein BGW39_011253 [Mortierella sp. 14UC]